MPTDPQIWIALLTLIALEIVLGIDNIIFISILTSRLPEKHQRRTRFIGLSMAMLARIALLFSISFVMRLTNPLFGVFGRDISGRDLILILGGLFLLAKSTHEIHSRIEEVPEEQGGNERASVRAVLFQILLLDLVFSLDSVITAVGMTDTLWIMVAAIVMAVLFMMAFAGAVSRLVNGHPTIKMLALSFLMLIGVTLIADGLGQHIPKGYIYFAMAFSAGVETLNVKLRARHRSVAN